MNELYTYWDIKTLILYIFLAIFGTFCLFLAKKKEERTGIKVKFFSIPYLSWFIVWVIIATYRYVAEGIGGADAIVYVNFFNNCFDKTLLTNFNRFGEFFIFINRFIHLFTSNYHVYFFIVYGFIVYSYILFYKELCPKKVSLVPTILTFHLFLRGFNTLRTELAISFILLGIVLMLKKHNIVAFILMFLSIFIHTASIIYSVLFLFYHFYKKGKFKLTIKNCIILSILAVFVGKFGQDILTGNLRSVLNGAYYSYIVAVASKSYFFNYIKIALGQLLFFLCIIIFNKWIKKDIEESDDERQKQLKNIWILCIFDIIAIPITYMLNIWRGYEYLYIVRLIMWGEIIHVIKIHSTSFTKKVVTLVTPLIFIFWFCLQIYRQYDISHLMPYIFEPFFK